MNPDDVVIQLCVNLHPVPFNAGQVADIAQCDVDTAERACELAASSGLCLRTKDKPPSGRGKHIYVGTRTKALAAARKRAKRC